MEVHNKSTSVKGKVRVSFADVKPAMPNIMGYVVESRTRDGDGGGT